jgi:hypothetical protein
MATSFNRTFETKLSIDKNITIKKWLCISARPILNEPLAHARKQFHDDFQTQGEFR